MGPLLGVARLLQSLSKPVRGPNRRFHSRGLTPAIFLYWWRDIGGHIHDRQSAVWKRLGDPSRSFASGALDPRV